ncbi:hypothetical protein, partial [Pseudomonas syringae]|uniref:hypothetical protein n=1 Tax=Pseudomonas syringae TaxID=317 RepID=UPI001C3F174F
LLLSLFTIAGAKISNPSWVNFQSAGWVSFQSAPTVLLSKRKNPPKGGFFGNLKGCKNHL